MLRLTTRRFAPSVASKSTESASLNARRSSARQQMMFTSVLVLVMRKIVNFCNFFIYLIQVPVRRMLSVHTQDSNIVYIVWGSLMALAVPYMVYPYLQEILDPDPRQKKEEERVRQNIQKGDDPLPFYRDKTNVRGQPMPVQVTDDTAVKLNIAPEWGSMDRFRQGRAEELANQRRRHEEWIRLQEQHREGQFGVFAHMDRWSNIDRPRRPPGMDEKAPAWSPSDLKGPATPLIPGKSQY